jgi:hypothetical protein
MAPADEPTCRMPAPTSLATVEVRLSAPIIRGAQAVDTRRVPRSVPSHDGYAGVIAPQHLRDGAAVSNACSVLRREVRQDGVQHVASLSAERAELDNELEAIEAGDLASIPTMLTLLNNQSTARRTDCSLRLWPTSTTPSGTSSPARTHGRTRCCA